MTAHQRELAPQSEQTGAPDDTGELLVALVEKVGTTLRDNSEQAWFSEFAHLIARLTRGIVQIDAHRHAHLSQSALGIIITFAYLAGQKAGRYADR
jgi:hypothetical protein